MPRTWNANLSLYRSFGVRSLLALRVAAVTATVLSTNCTLAKERPDPVPTAEPTRVTHPQPSGLPAETQLEDFVFDGGTVKQYLEKLEAAIQPRPLNTIFKGGAEQKKVGPVRLRRVTVRSAVEMLLSLSPAPLRIQFMGEAVQGTAPVFVIGCDPNTEDEVLTRSIRTRVYSLKAWTVATSAETKPIADTRRRSALDAIEQGLSIAEQQGPGPFIKPAVQYHADTGLLFVKANEEMQQVAESIVKELDASFRAIENAKKSEEDDQKRTLKMLSLQREVDTLRAKLDTAKKPPLLSGVVRVREDIRAKVLDVAREVTKQYGSIDGNLEISETPKGIQLKGPGDLVHYAVNAARAAAKVLGDDDAEFQEQSLPR